MKKFYKWFIISGLVLIFLAGVINLINYKNLGYHVDLFPSHDVISEPNNFIRQTDLQLFACYLLFIVCPPPLIFFILLKSFSKVKNENPRKHNKI